MKIIITLIDIYPVDQEIESDDVKLAVKLSEERPLGTSNSIRMTDSTHREINAQDIMESIDKEVVLLRYPQSACNGLTQRTFTYVPGSEAYGEVSSSLIQAISRHLFLLVFLFFATRRFWRHANQACQR